MSYQGDKPNRRQERQQPTTGYQQGTQPQQSQQQPYQTPQGQPQQGIQQPPQTQPQGTQQQPQQWQQQQTKQPRQTQQPPQTQGMPKQAQQPTQTTGFGGQQTGAAGGQQPAQAQTGTTTAGMATTPQQTGMGMQAQPQPAMGQPSFQPLSVEDVIETDVVTAQLDEPINSVAGKMAENNVGCVVVVEEDGQTPTGILTDRKIALATESIPDIAERPAEELVSGGLVSCTTDMTVSDVLERLQDEGIRRIPVVDEEGLIQGIVSLDDLLVVLKNQFDDAIGVIEKQVQP